MKNTIRIFILFIGDVAMLAAAFFVMLKISFPGAIDPSILEIHLVPFIIISILWLLIFYIFNLYNPSLVKPTIPHIRQIALAFIVSLALSITLFYIIPFFGIAPKSNLLIWGITFIILFIIWRRLFYGIFASFFKRNVVFIVKNPEDKYIKELTQHINNYPQSGFSLVGIFTSVQDFTNKNQNESIDVIIISKDIITNSKDFKSLYKISGNILDFAYAYEDMLSKISVTSIDESWFLHNIPSTQKTVYDFINRIISIIVSLVVLIISSPFTVISAVLIKLNDGGPIFYKQIRVGKKGLPFEIYKMRSMTVNAEKNGAQWSQDGDPRVTPVGRFLRKSHIDEIPQLWNVIKGDISLVGPRPERPEFVESLEEEIPYYHLRHIITPGFTGWAQIKFRYAGSVMDSKEKFEYDLFYIKNRNIFIDLGIIIRTIQIIFTH